MEAREGCLGPDSPTPKQRECAGCRRFLYWSVAKKAPTDEAQCDECLRDEIAYYWLSVPEDVQSA